MTAQDFEAKLAESATEYAIAVINRVCPSCGEETAWELDRCGFEEGARFARAHTLREVIEKLKSAGDIWIREDAYEIPAYEIDLLATWLESEYAAEMEEKKDE